MLAIAHEGKPVAERAFGAADLAFELLGLAVEAITVEAITGEAFGSWIAREIVAARDCCPNGLEDRASHPAPAARH